MGLISSLRFLSQLKGYHLASVRGRQQYAGRHLWGGNFWNRAMSLYFRNATAAGHPDFGPRYARYWAEVEPQMRRLGATPDARGDFGGKKVNPETLANSAAACNGAERSFSGSRSRSTRWRTRPAQA